MSSHVFVFFTLATAPATFRTCVAKVASMPLSCQTKTSAGNINQSPQENQTVPNRNGWLQAARKIREDKFLSRRTRNALSCPNKFLTPNSTGGGVPTPVKKKRERWKNVRFRQFSGFSGFARVYDHWVYPCVGWFEMTPKKSAQYGMVDGIGFPTLQKLDTSYWV